MRERGRNRQWYMQVALTSFCDVKVELCFIFLCTHQGREEGVWSLAAITYKCMEPARLVTNDFCRELGHLV